METYKAHETAVIDPGCTIGDGTHIWHFSHIMPGCSIGRNCNIGQNVVISPQVVLGDNVKVQNNVSVYTGVTCGDDVFLGPSCVFTNVVNPRSAVSRKDQYFENVCRQRCFYRCERNDRLRPYDRRICHDRCRGRGH